MTAIGRFAPSPSGPLHAGSLLAALASYVDSKSRAGQWLLRIDDIDTARSSADACEAICRALAAHGLSHDGPVLRQSDRVHRYAEALDQLWQQGQAYSCECTRAALKARALAQGHARYDQHCLGRGLPQSATHAARVHVDNRVVQWWEGDAVRDECVQLSVGDFVLKRRDGVFAYQLAVVVDDALDGVTHVVRGQDLEDNTGRQVYLQHCLGLETPAYCHVPLVCSADGRKLSKSNGALAIDTATPVENLKRAWAALGQTPAPRAFNSPTAFLDWAVHQWQPSSGQDVPL